MSSPVDADHIGAIRSFNRFYTNVIGVLNDRLLDSPYTVTEARVLFELAHGNGHDATDLRRSLGLDPGYLSRILSRLGREGLVERRPSERDRRRWALTLTDAGRSTARDLDLKSSDQIGELLSPLDTTGRSRVVEAMRRIRSELDPEHEPPPAALRELEPGDLGWVVGSQGAGYAELYGWNSEYEALVARVVSEFGSGHDPERERGWIAEMDGERVGSIFCVAGGGSTAKLRLLWVEPSARGRGVGRLLVRTCVDFAAERGYSAMTLWTVSLLHSARQLYREAGFTLASQEPVHLFGHHLTAQTWELSLTGREQ